MKLTTFTYQKNSGWSRPFPAADSDQTLVIIFGSPSFCRQPQPIMALAAAYPNSHLVGCSTAGEIFDREVLDDSLAVAVVEFEHTWLRTAISAISAATSYPAGMALARKLNQDDLRAIFVLSDGIDVNGSELVRGLNSVLPAHIVVTGGLAGDGDQFEYAWTISDGRPHPDQVTAVGLYGDRVQVGHGSKGGWDIFGPERRVTRSDGHILYGLDGRPALQLYKEYLGDMADGLPAAGLLFPLALRAARGDQKQIVRTILGIDEAGSALVFAGDIPQGYWAQLMKANFDRLVDGAHQAAVITRQNNPDVTAALCLAVSCVGRRLVLGERAEEELEAVLDALPENTRQIGLYSYGEISPFGIGHCDLHNQTMTLTTITEA